MQKKLVVLLTLVLVFSVFSVVGAQEVKNPDTFIEVNMGTIDSLDPHYQYDSASAEIIDNVYENLIKFNKGNINEFVPHLATEVPTVENGLIRENGTVYEFPIREGVTFQNGNPLTPEDVKYSFLRALIQDRDGGPVWMLYEPLFQKGSLADVVTEVLGEEKSPSELTAEESKKVYAYLEKAIEVDGNSVVFNLPQAFPPFLSIISQNNGVGAIIDKEWTIKQGGWDGQPGSIAEYTNPTKEEDPLFDTMNGTGPYELVEWVNGEEVILNRNDDYWREPASIKKVIIRMIDEWSTRKLMLQRGDADIVYVDKQYLPQVRNMDGVEVITGLPNLYMGAGLMNFNIVTEGNPDVHSGKLDGNGIPSNFFSDIHVRKGFLYSMNYEAFVKDVLQGDGQKGRGPIPEPFLGYDENSPTYNLDLEKAEEHFRQAFDGELWEKGFEITILYNTGNDVRKSAVDMLKYYVEQINPKFKVNVRGIQWATYLDKLIANKFTLGFIAWGADYADPHNFVVPFLASDGTYGGFKGKNYIEFAKENIDPLIEKGVSLTDPEAREKVYKELQNIAYEHAIDMYLYQPTAQVVMRDWVEGWYYNPIRDPGQYFYSLDK
ncbi:peptide/nickel transport system substrate-binding protein [Halanaerobium saccharolyticum]|uniref:Peptide/nickel transport system substrate-binding protein n=1 Tax=Halanaerobium saccharolyticum TaxID=43595 RepID=A0A4R6LUJ4_9FIRM|nr:ABC transporter substrate-binding protein [Halanaerobium saccharolyticum]TDO92106.1 peptide/nickel transport system substrate-binding protein [Halanaerobium saccharolyticum]